MIAAVLSQGAAMLSNLSSALRAILAKTSMGVRKPRATYTADEFIHHQSPTLAIGNCVVGS